MKHLFVLLILFFNSSLFAQQFSIFLTPGIMNYGGDLQAVGFTFSQSNLSIGGGISFQIKKLSVNTAIVTGSVEANDKYSTVNAIRNLSFKSSITEASINLEYDIFDITEEKKFTPYLFAGLGFTHFNPYTYDSSGIKTYLQPLGTEGQGLSKYPSRTLYNLYEFCVPLGIGLKYKINDKFTIGIEYNARFLNTDYLDDVSKTYPNEQALLAARGAKAVALSFRTPELIPSAIYPEDGQRGNPSQKDYFYTSALKVSYTLNQSGYYNKRNKSGITRCPRNIY